MRHLRSHGSRLDPPTIKEWLKEKGVQTGPYSYSHLNDEDTDFMKTPRDVGNPYSSSIHDDDELDNDFTLANKNAADYYNKKFRPEETISQSLQATTKRAQVIRFPFKDNKKSEYKISRGAPKFRDNSLASHIFLILIKKKQPVHITEIISGLQRKGKTKKYSVLHLYSTIHKVLCRNNHLFKKSDKSFFAVREGFKKSKKNKFTPPNIIKPTVDYAGVMELVETSFKEAIPKGKATSSEVFLLLKGLGFTGDYLQVRRVLKDKRFKKRGEIFALRHP